MITQDPANKPTTLKTKRWIFVLQAPVTSNRPILPPLNIKYKLIGVVGTTFAFVIFMISVVLAWQMMTTE